MRSFRGNRRPPRLNPDSERSTSTPIHKQPWFLGLVALVGLLGTLTGIITGLYSTIHSRFTEPAKKIPRNTEIVLDRSEDMKDTFEGSTKKIEAAVNATNLLLDGPVPNSANLALREIGDDCKIRFKKQPPLVRFSTDNNEEVSNVIRELKPGGKAGVYRAVLWAIDDFSDAERFEGVEREIIVIVGNKDACVATGGPRESDVREALKRSGIQATFHFIGLGLKEDAQKEILDLANVVNATVNVVYDNQQLTDVIHKIGEEHRVQPTRLSASKLGQIVDKIAASVNLVVNDIQKGDYFAAEDHLAAANIAYNESEIDVENLGRIYSDDQYKLIYSAKGVRDIQHQLISISEQILQEHRAKNANPSNLMTKFDVSRADHNVKWAEFHKRLSQYRSIIGNP
jgi:hypothetical protein